jgi:hypothetical protein
MPGISLVQLYWGARKSIQPESVADQGLTNIYPLWRHASSTTSNSANNTPKININNNKMDTNDKCHVPKNPETCPCDACIFLRDPAYFPYDLNKTNSRDTASNGSAPVAPTRASPAPAPNGKGASPPLEMPQSVASTDPKIAAQQASDMRNIVRRKLTGYVGFANLPNQWHRKSVRKGFNFNVMVVGT